ncbi:MAG: hypothetical protein EOS52_23690 [Mesorhizobium sp.]|uniref:hypothetical protein n=1 Tax=Mesorhizobium sp. TaxID=1871066 RepID=UPI000FE946F1|nr:hypothetical protein [Mesorhizobium sp.]RWC10775.1 MAG: hypothetical protein EOS52_23690 [Mesorhizobium sp.]
MTAYYVRSGATGAGTGADWANAYTAIATATSGKAAGDIFYVSEDHSETVVGSPTFSTSGSLSNPSKIICVDHTGSVPPVSADLRRTAVIGSTSQMSTGGSTYWYGIIMAPGGAITLGSSSANNYLVGCTIRVPSGANLQINGSTSTSAAQVFLDDTQVSFASTTSSIKVSGDFTWLNTASALQGTAVPTTLFIWQGSTANGVKITCRGVDFSAAGSGKTLVSNTATAGTVTVGLIDCKINSAVTIVSAPSTPGGLTVDCTRVSSSGVNYTHARYRYQGTLTEETTIVRTTGGATDGTTPIAQKIVTTANSSVVFPFQSIPIAIWNDSRSQQRCKAFGAAVRCQITTIFGPNVSISDRLVRRWRRS